MAEAAAPPSWYEDPWHQAGQRWWDGHTWTGHTAAAGSLLDCASITAQLDLGSGVCRLVDGGGAEIGSLSAGGGGAGSAAPSAHPAPQAGELMVATPGDINQPMATGPPAAFTTPSQPVAVRDVEGRTLFVLRPGGAGPGPGSLSVVVHGPDETELGRYGTGGTRGRTVQLSCSGQLIATVSRGAGGGGGKQISVCGTDGTTLAAVIMGKAAATAVSLSVAVVAPVSGTVRHLVLLMPPAFLAVAMSAMPSMPQMPGGAWMPGSGAVGARLAGMAIGAMFDMLGGD